MTIFFLKKINLLFLKMFKGPSLLRLFVMFEFCCDASNEGRLFYICFAHKADLSMQFEVNF